MRKTNEFNRETVGAHDCAQKIKKIKGKPVGAVAPKSAHTSRARQKRGITLIALIITIVVMLILVGVTINIAVNGGLFQQAGKAVSDTQNEIGEEQLLASGEIKIGDSWYNSMDDYLKGIESVKSLQEKHEFEYYSSLAKAVDAVNNGTTDHGDSDKENAVAGVYTIEDKDTNTEKTTVVLLKDTTEETRSSPAVDMTINLGGKILLFKDKVGIDVIAGNVIIDGRINGSAIEITRKDGGHARPIQVRANSELTVNGGKYISFSEGANTSCILSLGTLTINNATIKAYSNYVWESGAYTESTKAVESQGVLNLNNCNVMGIRTGVYCKGTLNIKGGIYEGFGYGGVCLLGGTNLYIENATIRQCAMPEGYTEIVGSSNTGLYIGGGSTSNNITVYMENCDIYGFEKSIYLSNVYGEQNNTLYISNSRINTDKKIRIDDGGHKLYIGKGCNFTAEHTTNPSAVIVTDEVYTK